MEAEELKDKSEMSAVNTCGPVTESSTAYPDQDMTTTSTESETTSTESAPKENLPQSSENSQQFDVSNTLKPGDKSTQDTKNVNEENKDKATEKEEHQSEDEDSDDDEEAVLESSPCGRWHKRKEQVFLYIIKVTATKRDIISPVLQLYHIF